MFDKLLNNSEAYDYLFGQHGMDLAKIDYIVAMINQKAAENVDNPEKIEILTKVVNLF